MEITPQIKSYIDKLPDTYRKVLAEFNFGGVLAELVKKHSLLLDQGDAILTESFLVLLGLEDEQGLRESLLDEGISAEKVNALIPDIGRLIFEPIRRELRQQDAIKDVENLSAEDVLSEIENPSRREPSAILPMKQTISVPKEAPSTNISPVIQKQMNPVATRLEGQVMISPQKIVLTPKQPEHEELPSSVNQPKRSDPYREPIE